MKLELFSFFLYLKDEAAVIIQGACRQQQARVKLRGKAAWQINEQLEYSSEQTQAKVRQ